MNKYDMVIIGGGPAGYPAAIEAGKHGKTVAIIEKSELGGTCLNVGCIPTKSLYESAVMYENSKRSATFGVLHDREPVLDFGTVARRKNEIIGVLRKGVEFLMNKAKTTVYKGEAKLIDKNTVEIKQDSGTVAIAGDSIIIATGSYPSSLPGLNCDGKFILTSDQFLKLEKLPKDIIVVGGGVVGMEFANIFATFGCNVTVVELMNSILLTEDDDVVSLVKRYSKAKNINIFTQTSIKDVNVVNDRISAVLSNDAKIEADVILVSVGRRYNTYGIGLENAGVETNKNGTLKVDEYMRTNVPNIFGAGDVIGGYMLAHAATREGIIASSNACGKSRKVDYTAMPWAVFTMPQVGTVGMNERKLKEKGLQGTYAVGKCFYKANGMAYCMGETDGFVKIIVDKESKNILGATIVGADASNLIAEITPLVGGPVDLITETIHSHPTLSELIHEAAEAVM